MIAPSSHGQLGLLGRSVVACVAAGAGVPIGWTLTRNAPAANWFLPTITLASAALLGVEVIRTANARVAWIVSLCAVLAGRAVYELAELVLHR